MLERYGFLKENHLIRILRNSMNYKIVETFVETEFMKPIRFLWSKIQYLQSLRCNHGYLVASYYVWVDQHMVSLNIVVILLHVL